MFNDADLLEDITRVFAVINFAEIVTAMTKVFTVGLNIRTQISSARVW